MHSRFEMHETPDNELNVAPVGVGAGLIDHRRPFQRSAVARLRLLSPTAVHARGDVQETAVKSPPDLGVRCRDQVVPFQRSRTVASLEVPENPVAMHARDEVQSSPSSSVSPAPAGLGLRSIDHLRPFQASASVEPRV